MHKCTLGHQNVGVCEVSHTYLLGSLRYGDKYVIYILISCGHMLLFTSMQLSCEQVSDMVST